MRRDPVLLALIVCIAAMIIAAGGLITWAIMEEVNGLKAGIVVDKAHYDEITTLIPVAAGNGNFVLVPVMQPECFALFLRDGEETGDVCVDPGAWGNVHEGDFWGQR